MSQLTPEEMQKRGALLKKAKQILLQEYAAIRTQQHQQWIRDSETSWRTNGILMAYPPGKIYPTEPEIIEKALELYNKSIATTPVNIEVPVISTISTPEIIETIETTETTAEPVVEETPSTSMINITDKLKEISDKASSVPVDPKLFTMSVTDYIETLTTLPPEEKVAEPIVEEIVEEPVVEELPTTTEPAPKHSLLRSVLSGWLSKNKDKET
jgi:hypothetical protein